MLPVDRLKEKIASKKAVIGVAGLGYVGLPLAVEFARNGFETIGVDVTLERVAQLNDGRNYIQDVSDEYVKEVVSKGTFRAESDFKSAGSMDVLFVCVPTPVTEHKDPDTSYIKSVADSFAKYLKKGHLVILKSTTYPDTTEGLVQPILEAAALEKDLVIGRDYFLAFSPERIDPGNTQFTTANTPVVVGGVTSACTEVASQAIQHICAHVHQVSSPKVAEMEKLLENTFRSVNIALVNELARLCDRIGGISMWEVVEAAATKPFGFMPFFPGPGLGGHCIPIDPYYLSWLARKYDFETNFITLSARINEEMPFYVVQAVVRAIAEQAVPLKQSRILVLGVAFKKNVDDTRHSPAEKVMALVGDLGVGEIAFHDPYVEEFSFHLGNKLTSIKGIELNADSISNYDVCILLTDHDNYPYDVIASGAKIVIDTRNAMKRVGSNLQNVTLLGGGRF